MSPDIISLLVDYTICCFLLLGRNTLHVDNWYFQGFQGILLAVGTLGCKMVASKLLRIADDVSYNLPLEFL